MIPMSIPGSSGRLALRKDDLLLRSEERLLNPGEKPTASGGQRNGDRPLLGAGCGCGPLSLRPLASNTTPLVGAVLAMMLPVAVALLMTGAAASDR
jgi:hypothetical protein